MANFRNILVCITFVGGLVSCGPYVSSQVTTFTEMPPSGSGKSFIIVPLKSQEGSLEFETYAIRVAANLEHYGYSQAVSGKSADFGVGFSYSIGNPTTVSGVAPIFGQTGGGYSYQSGNFNASGTGGYASGNYSGSTYTQPTYGVVGAVPYSNTTYTRTFNLVIFDLHQSTPTSLHLSFQGTVTSTGSNDTFSAVAGCMIDAAFYNFPGISGATVAVTEPQKKCSF